MTDEHRRSTDGRRQGEERRLNRNVPYTAKDRRVGDRRIGVSRRSAR